MLMFFADEGGMAEFHPRASDPPNVLFLQKKVGMTGTSRAEPLDRLPKSCPHDSFLFFVANKSKMTMHAPLACPCARLVVGPCPTMGAIESPPFSTPFKYGPHVLHFAVRGQEHAK